MKVIECKKIDTENHDSITYIRIEPENLSVTLKDIITSLSDLSWISRFDKLYIRSIFQKRAEDTAKYLANKILRDDGDKITEDSGEYVVSELAREALVSELKYLDISLAEIFKEQVSGNPGFDFYSANNQKVIILGEAKYNSRQNAYGVGMEITATEHQQNYSNLHTNIGQSPSQINRSEFNSWRREYWEWRSSNSD